MRVHGGVGIKNNIVSKDITDPDCVPMFYVSINGDTIITDGEKWFREITRLRGGNLSKMQSTLEPIDVFPLHRGLIKEAIRAYVAGKGGHLVFDGRRMKVDNDNANNYFSDLFTTPMNGEK